MPALKLLVFSWYIIKAVIEPELDFTPGLKELTIEDDHVVVCSTKIGRVYVATRTEHQTQQISNQLSIGGYALHARISFATDTVAKDIMVQLVTVIFSVV